MAEYLIQDTTLTEIANAIRTKTGKTEAIPVPNMAAQIAGITGGGSSELPSDVHTVTFMNGNTVLYQRHVVDGDTCADPIDRGLIETPTKESTAQYDYTYYGWGAEDGGAADSTILQNITGDKTVYAIFTATVRTYTITYYDEDGTTVLNTEQVAYGTVPSYTPTKDGGILVGWTPVISAVTGDASYVAQWEEVIGGAFGDNCTWLLKDGVLTINGSGDMADYSYLDYDEIPWMSYSEAITSVVIGEGITHLGACALYMIAGITSVSLPSGLTSIGDRAMNGCTGLTSITIPDTVTSIGNLGLNNTRITSITIPASVKKIGFRAFLNCSALARVTFEDTSGWYKTSSSSYAGGTSVTVTSATTNATNLTSTYAAYYWYDAS